MEFLIILGMTTVLIGFALAAAVIISELRKNRKFSSVGEKTYAKAAKHCIYGINNLRLHKKCRRRSKKKYETQ